MALSTLNVTIFWKQFFLYKFPQKEVAGINVQAVGRADPLTCMAIRILTETTHGLKLSWRKSKIMFDVCVWYGTILHKPLCVYQQASSNKLKHKTLTASMIWAVHTCSMKMFSVPKLCPPC
jgi:hypothetical protein